MVAVLVPARASLAQTAAPATRQVTYRDMVFSVPSSWPIIDLAADPSQCVHFDVSAVYLGHTGADPRCSSHLIGRADALQVEPADASNTGQAAKATTKSAINGESVRLQPTASTDAETRAVFPRPGILATLYHGSAGRAMDQVLSSFHPAPAGAAPALASPMASPAPASVTPKASAPAAPAAAQPSAAALPIGGTTGFVGEGFDTCAAPSQSTMAAWLASPYRSVGVYIGGVNRACAQPNLTTSWVTNVSNQGWLLAPIYVGLQAPCNPFPQAIDPNRPDPQGRAAADDASVQAAALGLGAGSPIYFDMEGYDSSQAACSQAVMAFLNAWTGELHSRGYASGVYGSSASTIADMVKLYPGTFNTPDDIWFASWGCCPHSVTGDSHIPASYWWPHRRLHQYSGGHNESWGGVTITMDSDFDDGALAGGNPGYVVDSWGGIHPFGGAQVMYGSMYAPGKDVARGIVVRPQGGGGYVLDDWGGIHGFGNAPFVYGTGYWPGQDVARAITLNPCDPIGTSGYVLDDWGGLHEFGGAPHLFGSGYWVGWDIARALVLTCATGEPAGYVMEGWGGLHPVGPAPQAFGEAYWSGWDIAVGAVLTSAWSGYTLDGWGGVHPFGGAPALVQSAYWPNTRNARGLAMVPGTPGGYVVETNGAIHWFGSALPQNSPGLSGSIARGITLVGH